MKKKICILLSGILLILLVVVGYVYFNQATKSIMYEDFRIEGSTATYNYNTRTGMVDLKIVYKGGGLKKLFLTSDDVIGNGFDFIVDVGNSIAIYDGKRKKWDKGFTDQSVAMEPEHNKTSTIYLKKSKPSIVVITDPSESMKNTKNERITKARVFDVNSNAGEYVYALELEEWNQVVQAGIGRYIFKK